MLSIEKEPTPLSGEASHLIFLEALEEYLQEQYKNPKNTAHSKELYQKLISIPKSIIQLHFHKNKISFNSKKHFNFTDQTLYKKLYKLGLYKIRLLNTIELDDFNKFLELLTSIHTNSPIQTHHHQPSSWGVYFIKAAQPSFKSTLNKASKDFQSLQVDVKKQSSLAAFLHNLKKSSPEKPIKKDLEKLAWTLVKNNRFDDAINLIEIYTSNELLTQSSASLWSKSMLIKILNHIKFFKIQKDYEEIFESFMATIPIHLFMQFFDHLEQFILHPNKMLFIRALARIHRGDTGFLQHISSFPASSHKLKHYQKMIKHLTLILNAPIEPKFIIDLSKKHGLLNKQKVAQLLLSHTDNKKASFWLIQNIEHQNPTTQLKIIEQLASVKQIYIAEMLADHMIKKDFFKRVPLILKEAAYEAILINSPKVFTHYIQSDKLKKGFFYKSRYLSEYMCLERVLKKNQFFSNSLTLKKVQKVSKSFVLKILNKAASLILSNTKNNSSLYQSQNI